MTFLTSGLIHELIFFYLTGHTSRGRWLSFFLVQVPFMTFERAVLDMLRNKGITIPQPILNLWAVGFMCVTSAYLFWGPAEQAGLVKQIISNVDAAYSGLAVAFKPFNKRVNEQLGPLIAHLPSKEALEFVPAW